MSIKNQLRRLKPYLAGLPFAHTYLRRRESQHILQHRPVRSPDFRWEILHDAPCARYDAGAFRVKDLLFCIGGYVSLDEVLSSIDVFDLSRCRWSRRITIPDNIPQSHFGIACDNKRYVYVAGGQLGPRCSPSVAAVFAFDVNEESWSTLPPLPQARYAPTMQLYRNRLHLIGGAGADRYTPAQEHWSIAVEDGRATEDAWRVETPIPRGGMHRASIVVKDELYVFGGQEGDFTPIEGDVLFSCNPYTFEEIYADAFRWERESQSWTSLPMMPVTASHIEFSICADNDLIVICGGSKFKDPESFTIELTDVVQLFDTQSQTWKVGGYLPYRSKTCLAAIHEGWLYVTMGQRDGGVNDARPGEIDSRTWRAKLP